MTDRPGSRLRALLPFGAVAAAYVGAALLLPTLAPIAIWDDWTYARSVETFIDGGGMHLGEAAANLVGQVAWGSLFASVFGFSFGVLRVSVICLALIGSAAVYGLCREVGANRTLSALGAASFLFSPLVFVLSYSFMTDVPLASMCAVAGYCYVRGFRGSTQSPGWLVAGSCAAAAAFLIRQQGVILPLSVMAAYVLSGIRVTRPDLIRTAALVCGVPLVVAVGFQVWLSQSHGLPENQEVFLSALRREPLTIARNIIEVTLQAVGYCAVFAVPLIAASSGSLKRMVSSNSRQWRRRWAATLAVVTGVAGLAAVVHPRARFPYGTSWVTNLGLGPKDLAVPKGRIFGPEVELVMSLAGAALLVVYLTWVWTSARERSVDQPPVVSRAASPRIYLTLLGCLLLGQVAGAVVPSISNRGFDRYFVPVAPFAIALLALSLARVRITVWAGAATAALLLVISTVGTRDFLELEQTAWEMADAAHRSGIPNSQLVSTAARDPYVLGGSIKDRIIDPPPGMPWWVKLYGLKTDQSHVIVAQPTEGDVTIETKRYSSWLTGQESLYLVRRPAPAK